ncbi:hypothetical protein BDV97DRAFT_232785 [Delphinella strobiligena]|nr:hypothetical protein BDV97DRAFT_232785 [Delphinella strobiligena]
MYSPPPPRDSSMQRVLRDPPVYIRYRGETLAWYIARDLLRLSPECRPWRALSGLRLERFRSRVHVTSNKTFDSTSWASIHPYIKLFANERSLSEPYSMLCKDTSGARQIGKCCRMVIDEQGTSLDVFFLQRRHTEEMRIDRQYKRGMLNNQHRRMVLFPQN